MNHSSRRKLNQTTLFSNLKNIVLPCTISSSTKNLSVNKPVEKNIITYSRDLLTYGKAGSDH